MRVELISRALLLFLVEFNGAARASGIKGKRKEKKLERASTCFKSRKKMDVYTSRDHE
jgi:hypothetical protein